MAMLNAPTMECDRVNLRRSVPEDKPLRIEDFSARRRVSEALHAVDRPMPSTPAPASVEPASPLVSHPIRVRVAPPTDADPGAIVEGTYTLTEDGVLRVYDTDRNLLGTEHLHPGADAGAAARRVLREKKGARGILEPIPALIMPHKDKE